jgi:hypothetical protein
VKLRRSAQASHPGLPCCTVRGCKACRRCGDACLQIVPGRYELIDEGQDFVTMVDYAHTPDALNALLDTVRECSDCKRIILVFGCGGDRDQGKRPYMGEIAHYKADVVILTNDNPRTEDPEDIIDDIVDGFPDDVTQAFETSTYNYMVDVGRVPPVRLCCLMWLQCPIAWHACMHCRAAEWRRDAGCLDDSCCPLHRFLSKSCWSGKGSSRGT